MPSLFEEFGLCEDLPGIVRSAAEMIQEEDELARAEVELLRCEFVELVLSVRAVPECDRAVTYAEKLSSMAETRAHHTLARYGVSPAVACVLPDGLLLALPKFGAAQLEVVRQWRELSGDRVVA